MPQRDDEESRISWFRTESLAEGRPYVDAGDLFPLRKMPRKVKDYNRAGWIEVEPKYDDIEAVNRLKERKSNGWKDLEPKQAIDQNKPEPADVVQQESEQKQDDIEVINKQVPENSDDHQEHDELKSTLQKDQDLHDRKLDRHNRFVELATERDVQPTPHLASEGSRRIHILGVGPTGRFVAHALASLSDRPPVTLLFDREELLRKWQAEGQLMEVIQDDASDVQAGFDVENLNSSYSRNPLRNMEQIEMLVITTKAFRTVPLLRLLKNRLGPTSTICFLQNPMGIMEQVSQQVFPDPSNRPRYMCGNTSHLLVPSKRAFTTQQKRPGQIFLSLVPMAGLNGELPQKGDFVADISGTSSMTPIVRRMNYGWTASSRKLMRTLTRSTHLNATGLQYRDLLVVQLEKLAVSAVIEPLSVVFDCQCGDLLSNYAVTELMRNILDETTKVLGTLPELAEAQKLGKILDPKRLEYLFVRLAQRSSLHHTSMLQDVRKGIRPDIDYLNGYIVRRGEELGIPCPVNKAVIQIVKAKHAITSRKIAGYIPLEDA
jgi:2-dehydropantoate 2-reductase